jgi:ATP-dependent helicase HrpB
MLAFPVHPRHARLLLTAGELGCVRTAALAAALTQGRSLLRRSSDRDTDQARDDLFGEASSDYFILLRAFQHASRHQFRADACRRLGLNAGAAREAGQLAEQFLRIARDQGLSTENAPSMSDEALQRCILGAFPDQVAVRRDTGTLRCELVHGRRGVLARASAVRDASLLVASEVCEIGRGATGGDTEVLITLATAIREEWLREMFPDDCRETTTVVFDETRRRVVARRETCFRDLVLRAAQTDDVPPAQAAALLAAKVTDGDCPLGQWDHEVEQWVVRLNRLAGWMPELGLPALTGEDRRFLVEQICLGAFSYRDLKERPVWPVLRSWLSTAQQELLEKFAPVRLELPSGRRWKIAYDEKAPPTIAARIQDLYGVEGRLCIAAGRGPLVIQVLAPNHRPVQVTQDLSTFWREAYPRLKQELQRRYPKHEWRE